MLKAEIIGNLGSSASVRSINGKEFVTFNVAHEERVKGEKATVWVSVLWYGNGGNLINYLKTGARVFVRGDLQASVYTRKDGTSGVSMSVMAKEVQMCQFAPQENQSLPPQPPQNPPVRMPMQSTQPPHSQPMFSPADLAPQDNDLPF